MRYILIMFFLLLIGCDTEIASVYKQAKENPENVICYNLYGKYNLNGRYCTYYEGDIK